MSNYKYPTPQLLFKAICDTIRAKTGSNDKIAHQDIPDLIDGISPENAYLSSILNIINGNTSNISNKDITSIPEYRFLNNTQIKQVDLPECTSIGNNAFTGCINLTTVNLPKCTSIGAYAFGRYLLTGGRTDYTIEEYNACINLTTVNLPKCTSIEWNAFWNCKNLTTIILGNNQVTSLKNTNEFSGSKIGNGIGYVYVPNNLVNNYKASTDWSNYANQIKPISELPSNLKEEYGYD